MVRRLSILTLCTILIALDSPAQIAEDLMVGGHMDLVKTDYQEPLQKIQFGAEVNYFATRTITATAGFEYWSADGVSFLVGARWYPNDQAFLRIRGLVGANDLSIGGGWTEPINENWKFEAIGDFYFKIDFAIRVGVVYVIRKK